MRSISGDEELWRIPQLNFLRVRRTVKGCTLPSNACGEHMFNVRMGQPPSELFAPPAQVAMGVRPAENAGR